MEYWSLKIMTIMTFLMIYEDLYEILLSGKNEDTQLSVQYGINNL